MPRDHETFGKRRVPIAEFRSIEEDFKRGTLLKRRERALVIYLTPLLTMAVVALIVSSSEARALVLELGAKGFEIGREWLLRGFIE